MADEIFDRAIRASFERQLAAHRIPAFETLLAGVAVHKRRLVPAWISVAAAAAVVATTALVQLQQREHDAATQRLMAELSVSTRWFAPSDRLLDPRAGEQFLGVPAFDDMTYSLDEVKTWL
jgi:hypothetical protein